MAANITLTFKDGATPELTRLVSLLSGSRRQQLNEAGGRAAAEGARDYHRQFDAQGGWFNKSRSTWGPGRSRTHWATQVARAWSAGPASANLAIISNDHPHLPLKVYGGTVTHPKALTIPVHPRAHGRSTRAFERIMGVKLFRPPGKSVLMFVERAGLAAKVAYVLRKSVTHKPWPGAVPEADAILIPFVQSIQEEYSKYI